MKVQLQSETTALPGYKKLYLLFEISGSRLSRKVAKALQRKNPLYVAGVEPKVSLYLGKSKPEQIVKAKVKDDKAAATSRLSFWDRLRKENPEYTMSCVCGCWFRVKKHYSRHQAKCSVLAMYRDRYQRVYNSVLVERYGDPKIKQKLKRQKAIERRRQAKAEKEARDARKSKDLGEKKVRRKAKKRSKK